MHKKRGIRACKFDKIYQLGDSISDTGNCIRDGFCGAHSSCSKLPYGMNYFHKPTGRCSNALESGLPLLNPYKDQSANFTHGANFAVAGATALSAQVLAKKKIAMSITNSSLSVQLDWMASHFKTTCSPDCPAQLKKSLFLVGHIGGNEINFGLSQGKTMEELRRMVPDIVQTIIHGVKRVIGFGATRILVPGNFPKGCGPSFLVQFMTNNSAAYDEYHCLKDLNNLAIFYNDHLQQAIDEMKKEYPNITLIYGDYYNAYIWLLQNAVSLVMMPVTRSKNTGKQVDVAAGEGTSKSPTIPANQSEAPAEHASETSPNPEEIRGRGTISPEPPINVVDQDLRNAVQLLTHIVVGQVQGQAIPVAGSSSTDRATILRYLHFDLEATLSKLTRVQMTHVFVLKVKDSASNRRVEFNQVFSGIAIQERARKCRGALPSLSGSSKRLPPVFEIQRGKEWRYLITKKFVIERGLTE
ncbi:hypothetical protein CQW23_18909 [Capsicum baccatum]|uniref:GDSL esterase/lipase n=1 Tax=Capsicum baccatum TaxID=33114 RepID=A0A2G2W497_CAPBA|nr:hypothetical protein CQW23_18909 [Capsicum baccatum]